MPLHKARSYKICALGSITFSSYTGTPTAHRQELLCAVEVTSAWPQLEHEELQHIWNKEACSATDMLVKKNGVNKRNAIISWMNKLYIQKPDVSQCYNTMTKKVPSNSLNAHFHTGSYPAILLNQKQHMAPVSTGTKQLFSLVQQSGASSDHAKCCFIGHKTKSLKKTRLMLIASSRHK